MVSVREPREGPPYFIENACIAVAELLGTFTKV